MFCLLTVSRIFECQPGDSRSLKITSTLHIWINLMYAKCQNPLDVALRIFWWGMTPVGMRCCRLWAHLVNFYEVFVSKRVHFLNYRNVDTRWLNHGIICCVIFASSKVMCFHITFRMSHTVNVVRLQYLICDLCFI